MLIKNKIWVLGNLLARFHSEEYQIDQMLQFIKTNRDHLITLFWDVIVIESKTKELETETKKTLSKFSSSSKKSQRNWVFRVWKERNHASILTNPFPNFRKIAQM